MSKIEGIVNKIKTKLKESDPKLTEDQISRRDKILNSDNPDFKGYGHKMSEMERIAKLLYNENKCNYKEAVEVFKKLIDSNIHEEKFVGIYFINQLKKDFNESTIKTFKKEFQNYCDTWAICDSTMIKVIGPFLSIKGNEKLAEKTIEEWSNSKNMWIRRASMVILLKIVMIKKEFDNEYVFTLVEKMLQYDEDYIQKGIGWLLKTCSKYDPDVIINYLEKNKKQLPRLTLRYASEKLPKDTRARILKK